MGAKEDGHFGAPALAKLHKEKKGTENGACLTGHNFKYEKKAPSLETSCNYRFQAYKQAKANGRIRGKLHLYNQKLNQLKKAGRIPTSAYRGKKNPKKKNPAHYCASLPPPQKGDWNLGGPNRPIHRKTFKSPKIGITIPLAMNFSQDTWPYWNNAHHILPKGTLKDTILKKTEAVSNTIQKALLKAKYNVNHKKNMFMLPQDRRVGIILELVRHITLKHRAAAVKKDVMNHPEYNQFVVGELQPVIDQYEQIAQQAVDNLGKRHGIPNATLSKDQLEAVSKTMLDQIFVWCAVPGASISQHAAAEMGWAPPVTV